MKKSDFSKWFELQFGKRPKAMDNLDFLELSMQYKIEKEKFDARTKWDNQYDSCLKAWVGGQL